MTKNKALKTVVVGLGSVGMRHARNLKLLGVNKIIGVDPNTACHTKFIKEIGATVFENLFDALDLNPDLSIIASPNQYHIEQAQACADADSHLFIEKPVGTSNDGVNQLIETINIKNLFAHVGSNWKFHTAFKTMKSLLDNKEIGQITGVQVLAGQWLPDWHPWEDYRQGYSARKELGGGIVFDSHEFDYVTWLLGPVADMSGFTAQSGALEISTEDVACACLKMASGALVTIHVDYIQRHAQRRYHISGTEGTIEWDINNNTIQLLKSVPGSSNVINVEEKDTNAMYVAQLEHILAGIQNPQLTPMTSVADASQALNIQLQLKLAA